MSADTHHLAAMRRLRSQMRAQERAASQRHAQRALVLSLASAYSGAEAGKRRVGLKKQCTTSCVAYMALWDVRECLARGESQKNEAVY